MQTQETNVIQFAPKTAEPSAEVLTAFRQWREHAAYIDGNGNYRLKIEGERRRIAPWNKTVKRLFKDVSDFHQAARTYYPSEPEVVLSGGMYRFQVTAPAEVPETFVYIFCEVCERSFEASDAEEARAMLDAHMMIAHKPEDEPPTGTDDHTSGTDEHSTDTSNAAGETSPQHFATVETLKALKVLNDAACVELKKAGEADGEQSFARVMLGDVVMSINVNKVAKWAALCDAPQVTFEFEYGSGLTLQAGTSFIRFAQGSIPFNLTPIELTSTASGEIIAPSVPDKKTLQAARKELAEQRKQAKAKAEGRKAVGRAMSAVNEAKRAEEYAEKLEREARETIAEAEELTPDDCEDALTIARRVRDLRRLKREVERAIEDPQQQTAENFAWITDEHRATYAGAFATYSKARERQENYNPAYDWKKCKANDATRKRFATQTEKALAAVAGVLRTAFEEYTRADVREIADISPEYVEQYGEMMANLRARETVFGRLFNIKAQTVKRELRKMPRELAEAHREVKQKHTEAYAALLEVEHAIKDSERAAYERLLTKYAPEHATLAQAA